jgi:hypothetical protein
MNKKIVKSTIDKAEIQLKKCFEMLSGFLAGRQGDKLIFEFQPVLAETLYNLMKFYQELCSTERNLISRKAKLNYNWFSKSMKQLSRYKEAISEVIGIGKCLGDSFAWLFYRDNMVELEKHLSHKETGLFPAGIGGYAEVRFIKENCSISGCFVLYHGITTMLRIGDFSLYAIDHGIIGTGELKARKNDDNTIAVQAHIFSKYRMKIEELGERINTEEKQDVFHEIRLKRQMESINSLLEKPTSSMHQNIYGDNAFGIVDDFYRVGKHVKVSKDKAVLALGISSRNVKLSNNLLSSKKEEAPLPNELTSKTIEILIKNSIYNQIAIGHVDNKLGHGQVPVFWWGIDIKTIEKFIFQQLKIITLYNPAHLYEHFQNMGFTITIDDKHQALIEKSEEGKRMTIGNLNQFENLIITNFLPVKVVIETFERVLQKFEHGEIEPNTKVKLSVYQVSF